MNNSERALTTGDLELIERIVYKSADDVATSIARSFERLEERIDAADSRIYARLGELDENIAVNRQTFADRISELTDELRERESTAENAEHES